METTPHILPRACEESRTRTLPSLQTNKRVFAPDALCQPEDKMFQQSQQLEADLQPSVRTCS